MPPVQTAVRCSSCGQPFNAIIRTLIDAKRDPEGKAQLVTGRVNQFPCPNCGNTNLLATPLMYHDPAKELLMVFIPSQLGLQRGSEEKIIGDLLNELTTSIPKEEFRGYMFNPRRVLTLQGMIDQVLQADGITPEMLEAQRKRVELVQTLMESRPEQLINVIHDNDAIITREFVQTLSAMAQRVMNSGQAEMAEALMALQEIVVQESSYGKELIQQVKVREQIIQEVAQEIEKLGEKAQRSDFLELTQRYIDQPQHIEALVGLVRPVFDYQFFQEFTVSIGKAPASDRARLEALRDNLLALIETVDKQSQAMMQRAVELLQAILSSPNPDELIAANITLIDDAFMTVLVANIQDAERRKDLQVSSRLKDIHNRVVTALQAQMQPELLFVNDLLSLNNDDDVRKALADHAKDFGDILLEVLDSLQDVLMQQNQPEILRRIAFIREEAAKVLS